MVGAREEPSVTVRRHSAISKRENLGHINVSEGIDRTAKGRPVNPAIVGVLSEPSALYFVTLYPR